MKKEITGIWKQLLDILIVYLSAIVLAGTVSFFKSHLLIFRQNASAIVAAGFLIIAFSAIYLRKEDISDYGLSFKFWKSELIFVTILCIIIFPLYVVGFKIYWNPPSSFSFRLNLPLSSFILSHFFVVALPEEVLFRGFIQQRLGQIFKKRIYIAGFSIGLHIPAASILFSLGHLVTNPAPQRLATFFPALIFGLIKERKGSLLGCTIMHALCNIFSDVIVQGYFPKK